MAWLIEWYCCLSCFHLVVAVLQSDMLGRSDFSQQRWPAEIARSRLKFKSKNLNGPASAPDSSPALLRETHRQHSLLYFAIFEQICLKKVLFRTETSPLLFVQPFIVNELASVDGKNCLSFLLHFRVVFLFSPFLLTPPPNTFYILSDFLRFFWVFSKKHWV